MDLKAERSDFLKREKEQLEIARIHWEKERQSFKHSDINTFIAKTKNDDDLSVLMEKMTEWVNLTKGDETKNKVYLELLKCVFRIHSYCFNIETTISQAGALYFTSEEILKNTVGHNSKEKIVYINKIKQLEKELENAKKQIEFHENGKRK